MLKKCLPAAVGVDKNLYIFYRSGPVHRFLVHPSGPETSSLPAHLPSTLRKRLQTVAQKVQRDKVSGSLRSTFIVNGKKKTVTITISPLKNDPDLMLVVFREARKTTQLPKKDSIDEMEQIQQLEQELSVFRKNHEQNLSQLRNINKELHRSNEELHAENEKGEISHEKLQSLSKELITVNNQLLEKNNELETINNDLNNFLTSAAIPALFIDEQLRVRRFTPALTKLVKLLPVDIGKPLTNFAYEKLGFGLMDQARIVIRGGEVQREEVSIIGSCFLRTIRPYTTGNNRVQVVIVTFADITDIKKAESSLRESEEKFRIVADFTYDWEYWLDKNNRFLYVTPSCKHVTGYSREEFMNDPSLYGRIIHPEDRDRVTKHLANDPTSVQDFELEFRIIHRNGDVRWINHACRPVQVESDKYSGPEIRGRRAVNRDITIRKQAEKTLRENENKFSISFKSSPGFMYISDLETGLFIDANEAFCRMIGFVREEILGHTSTELRIVRPEEREKLFSKLKEEGHILNHDAKIRNKNGESRDILYSAEVIKLGEKQCVLSTGIDITERNITQAALQVAAERFNRIISSNIVGIIIADFTGIIWFANDYFLNIIGYNQQDLAQKINMNKITPDEFQHLDHDAFSQLNKNGIAAPYEKQFDRKDGSRVWVYLSDTILPGPQHHIIAFVLDITKRKKAEEALRKSEAGLKRSQAIAHLGSWELDLVTNRLTWSDEVYWIFDLKYQDFGGTYEEFLSHVHPEDRDAVDSAYAGSIRDGRDYYEIEHRVIRKCTGEIRYVHEKCHHIRDQQGKIVRSVGMVHGITNRKQAELQLKKYADELAAANRDLESFSYSVSHDMRNPLGIISGFITILKEDYSKSLDEEGREYLERICESIRKMQLLIDDMLSLSRVGRQEIKREDVDLSDLVHDLLDELQRSEPERKVEIVIQDNLHASADLSLIRLAIDNVLRNAWKFTSTKKNARIEFGSTVVDNNTTFFVSDNGVGFNMEFAQRIFEPFKRGHTDKQFSGTGVGLSIVKRVIAGHGGKIWAEGRPGEGASIFFTLP